jgi:ABC-type amino acid transport substrate-binding protein
MTISRRIFGTAGVAGTAAAAVAVTRSASAQSAMDGIIRRGEIRLGYILSPPNTSRDPRTNEVTGLYADAAKVIVAEAGLRLVWVETTWGTFAAGLQSGQFDLSIAGTFATVRRALAVDFTNPIFYNGYSGVARANDGRFRTLQDLNNPGVRIAVVQGGAAEDFVRRNLPRAQVVALGTGNLTAPFVEVASGRADVGIEDANTTAMFVRQQPLVRDIFADQPFNFLPLAWAVRKGNQDILGFINQGIENMMVSGRWADIARPYGVRGRFVVKREMIPWPSEA